MQSRDLKRKLDLGQTAIGLLTPYPDPNLAEVMALAGWDFLILDGEHGVVEPSDMAGFARACELRGSVPLARCPSIERGMLSRFLDAGAQGIMAPMIGSAVDARRVIEATKYPPIGKRGLAQARGSGFGVTCPLADFPAASNDSTMVIVQIETAEAVEAIDQIVSTEGVDVFFIGPADLSASFGQPMNIMHADVLGAIGAVSKAVNDSGKTLGVLVSDVSHIPFAKGIGARFIAVYADPLYFSISREFISAIRG